MVYRLFRHDFFMSHNNADLLSQVFESLLTGNEQAVYADSAYKSKAHEKQSA
jgi:hypothetical protein